MPTVTVIFGEQTKKIEVETGCTVGEAVIRTGLPLEQPCAGRGTCGKCKVLVESGTLFPGGIPVADDLPVSGVDTPDEIEYKHLSAGELALDNRLACRARVVGDARIILAPTVVYSNKIFRSSNRYRQTDTPLGLAIDLGSTTVAAFLTMLDDGEVCAGGAALNQQTVFGADVISRLHAAVEHPENAERLHRLALASINQAVDSLKLPPRIRNRIEQVTIVGNVAMHHLLTRLPVDRLSVMPFQPYDCKPMRDAAYLMGGIFPAHAKVTLAPMIGGFVGSDALACLAYFNYDNPPGPLAAIDLGTNGEVLVTNGERILTASTAAGPAFEGVFISCGTRAVDGAITRVTLLGDELALETIGNQAPVGLTGSGLLSLVHTLWKAGLVEENGRISDQPQVAKRLVERTENGHRRVKITPDGRLGLTQWDVRELQKAKGAIRAAFEILMDKLNLDVNDLSKVILTGSFGGQIDIDAAVDLGMLPPVDRSKITTVANGAGLGAATFLTEAGFERGVELAQKAEQIDLDLDPQFIARYVSSMALARDGSVTIKSTLLS